MKKFLAAILVLTILVSTVAFAADLLLFKKNAYLYEKPRAYKTSTVIRKGSVAEGKASPKMTKGHYSMIKINGKKFYVKSELVKVVEDRPVKIVYAAGGTGKSKVLDKVGEDYKTDYTMVKALKKCNARKYASLQGKALFTFKKGKWMTYCKKSALDDRGVRWYKVVNSKGVTGWVSAEYTELAK